MVPSANTVLSSPMMMVPDVYIQYVQGIFPHRLLGLHSQLLVLDCTLMSPPDISTVYEINVTLIFSFKTEALL